MKQPLKQIDAYSIDSSTNNRRYRKDRIIELAKLLTEDLEKEKRKEESLCQVCYYDKSRIGGAAITFRPCGCCGKEQCYASTCTDVLCLDCAKELTLCKHCGALIDLTKTHWKTTKEILDKMEGIK